MTRLLITQRVASICKSVIQHKIGVLGPACKVSRTYVNCATYTQSNNVWRNSLCKSKWLSLSRRSCIHTSPASLNNLISSDFIVGSPYPELDLPTDVTVHEMIFKACEKHKDSIALEEYLTGRKYTYEELKEKSIQLARGLSDLGLKKNDVILAFTPNTIDFTVLCLACSILGIWFSAANPQYMPAELARQMEHSESKAIFVFNPFVEIVKQALSHNPALKEQVKHVFTFGEGTEFPSFSSLFKTERADLPENQSDPKNDVFALPFSSGTTGFPKGVMVTHYNVVANVLQSVHVAPKEGASVLGLLPFFHIFGLVFIQFTALNAGASVVILPQFEPQLFLECLQNKKIQLAYLVPPLVLFLAKHPLVAQYDLSALADCFCGAAPMGEELTKEFLTRFNHKVRLGQGYGLTETSPVVCVDLDFRIGSIGQLVPNTLAKIIDVETGKNLGPGEAGEFCMIGPQIMKGYFKNDEATREMIGSDGWLHTGDIAHYNEDGVFYIKDRLKELIKYKGFQVAPAELEAFLLNHPAVADVGVIGIFDVRVGERAKAFVVKKPDVEVSADDLVNYVKENMSEIKHLHGGLEFVDHIPKSPSGKILRRILRDKYSV